MLIYFHSFYLKHITRETNTYYGNAMYCGACLNSMWQRDLRAMWQHYTTAEHEWKKWNRYQIISDISYSCATKTAYWNSRAKIIVYQGQAKRICKLKTKPLYQLLHPMPYIMVFHIVYSFFNSIYCAHWKKINHFIVNHRDVNFTKDVSKNRKRS